MLCSGGPREHQSYWDTIGTNNISYHNTTTSQDKALDITDIYSDSDSNTEMVSFKKKSSALRDQVRFKSLSLGI